MGEHLLFILYLKQNKTYLSFESARIRTFNLDITFQNNIIHFVSTSDFLATVIYNLSFTLKLFYTSVIVLNQENYNFYSFVCWN